MENCKLPRDLMADILTRLPVKSLMQFKCVCKHFYNLIKSDHHFMHKHYEISKAKTDCVLLEVGWNIREYYLLYKEYERNEIGCIYLDIPKISRIQYVKCCQGMLCIISPRIDLIKLKDVDYLIYDVLIWNPSIKKIKALPSITVPYKLPNYPDAMDAFGFGISNNMTWKVVMLLEIDDVLGAGRGNNVHQITMVYSQIAGNLGSWRQINSITSCRYIESDDFYLKGRYYWRAKSYTNETFGEHLLWFDMDDEIFGTIELPSNVVIGSVTIMNGTIALLGRPGLEDYSCIEIWLMTETDNNTYWLKQTSINSVVNIDNNEYWRSIGIWNVDSQLLVFLDTKDDWDPQFATRDVPYFISVDLVTQERKMFYISQEEKSINIASNPTEYFQVYKERNIDITEEWNFKIFMRVAIYGRVYRESLHFL